MSAEQFKSPEQRKNATTELENERAEKLAELRETSPEKTSAEASENQAEQARQVIEHQEVKPEPAAAEAAPRKSPHPLLDHHLNYAHTLASVQRQLNPISRSFSKVIHTPIVERASEALEATLARPSVMLGSTWTALIVGAVFYLTARHYGYMLSGSELLFSFIVGALLGLLVEGLWRSLKRR